jgi:hypothetical protein
MNNNIIIGPGLLTLTASFSSSSPAFSSLLPQLPRLFFVTYAVTSASINGYLT